MITLIPNRFWFGKYGTPYKIRAGLSANHNRERNYPDGPG